jgi:predicted Zn-dependent peptidase
MVFAGALVVFTVASLSAQMNVTFIEYDLPNGLHVILHQDRAVPIVSQVVSYHVGSKNEKPDRTGFAHFFEHLMFEGSPNIKRGEFTKIIQGAGGTRNAYTTFDKTVYWITMPSNQLELAMWLESERMLHLLIDSVGIETQRGVVKEERKQRIDNQPYGSVLEETMSHAYTQHPYRWTPIGSSQYIDRATYDEFQEFYRAFYVPENACLVIAGDIEIDRTKELVEMYYGEIPAGGEEIFRPSIAEPPQTVEIRDTVYDNIQLPAVIMAYHMPEQGTDDYYALGMLTTLLSGGESSRMTKRIVDREKLALALQAIPLDLEDPSVFIVLAVANFGKSLGDVEKALTEEIANVQDTLLSEREFTKIRSQVETAFVRKNSTVQGKAEQLANYHIFFGSAQLINREIERYMSVTREDISRVARLYLRQDNRTVLHYLPASEAD